MNMDAMKELIKLDPFYQNGIAEYKITEFDPVKRSSRFAEFITD